MLERPVRVRVVSCALCRRATVFVALRLHAPRWCVPEQCHWRTDACAAAAAADPQTRLHPVRFPDAAWTLRFRTPSFADAAAALASAGPAQQKQQRSQTPRPPLKKKEDAAAAAEEEEEEAVKCTLPDLQAARCPRLVLWLLQLVPDRRGGVQSVQSLAVSTLLLSPQFLAHLAAAAGAAVTVQCVLASCASLTAPTVAAAFEHALFTGTEPLPPSVLQQQQQQQQQAVRSAVGVLFLEFVALPANAEEAHHIRSKSASDLPTAAALIGSPPVKSTATTPAVTTTTTTTTNITTTTATTAPAATAPTVPTTTTGNPPLRRSTSRALALDATMHKVLLQAMPPARSPSGSTDYSCCFSVTVHAAINLPMLHHATPPSVFVLLRPESRKPQHGGEKAASLVERRKRNAVWRNPLRLYLTQAAVEGENMHVALTDRHSKQHLVRFVMPAAAARPFVQQHVGLVFSREGSFVLFTVERDPVLEELRAFRDDAHCTAHLTVSDMAWVNCAPRPATTATSPSLPPAPAAATTAAAAAARALMIVARPVLHMRAYRSGALASLADPASQACSVKLPFVAATHSTDADGVFQLESLPESDAVVSPITEVSEAPAWGGARLAMFLDTNEFAAAASAGSSSNSGDGSASGSSTDDDDSGGVVFEFFDCVFAREPNCVVPGKRLLFCGFAVLPAAVLVNRSKWGALASVSLPVITAAAPSPAAPAAVFQAQVIVESSLRWLAQRFAVPQLESDSDSAKSTTTSEDDTPRTRPPPRLRASPPQPPQQLQQHIQQALQQQPQQHVAPLNHLTRRRQQPSSPQQPPQPQPQQQQPQPQQQQAPPPRTKTVPPGSGAGAGRGAGHGAAATAAPVVVPTHPRPTEDYLIQLLNQTTQERDSLEDQLSACQAELERLRARCDNRALLQAYREQGEAMARLARENARIPELEYRLHKQAKEIEALRCVVLELSGIAPPPAVPAPTLQRRSLAQPRPQQQQPQQQQQQQQQLHPRVQPQRQHQFFQ